MQLNRFTASEYDKYNKAKATIASLQSRYAIVATPSEKLGILDSVIEISSGIPALIKDHVDAQVAKAGFLNDLGHTSEGNKIHASIYNKNYKIGLEISPDSYVSALKGSVMYQENISRSMLLKMIQNAEQKVKECPKACWRLLQLHGGMEILRYKRIKAGIKILNRMLHIVEDQDITEKTTAYVIYATLMLHANAAQKRKAIALLESLPDEVKQDSAYATLGDLCFRLKEITKAIDYYKKSLKLSEKLGTTLSYETYAALSNCYFLKKDKKNAMTSLKQAERMLRRMEFVPSEKCSHNRLKVLRRSIERMPNTGGATLEPVRTNVLRKCHNPICSNVEAKLSEFQKCNRCVAAVYCTKKCQKYHWHHGHKKACKKKKT